VVIGFALILSAIIDGADGLKGLKTELSDAAVN